MYPIQTIAFFPKERNRRIDNWQIATDTLIAIIKAQRQNFPQGLEIVSPGIYLGQNIFVSIWKKCNCYYQLPYFVSD